MGVLGEHDSHELVDPPGTPKNTLNDTQDIWIYVVDDEPLIGEVLHTYFQMEGYPTALFTDPEAALRAFQSAPMYPRLLVTDYVMTPINGMELLAQCLALAPRLRSIVISGNVGENELVGHSARPDRFVRKPFNTQILLQIVESLIGKGIGGSPAKPAGQHPKLGGSR